MAIVKGISELTPNSHYILGATLRKRTLNIQLFLASFPTQVKFVWRYRATGLDEGYTSRNFEILDTV